MRIYVILCLFGKIELILETTLKNLATQEMPYLLISSSLNLFLFWKNLIIKVGKKFWPQLISHPVPPIFLFFVCLGMSTNQKLQFLEDKTPIRISWCKYMSYFYFFPILTWVIEEQCTPSNFMLSWQNLSGNLWRNIAHTVWHRVWLERSSDRR